MRWTGARPPFRGCPWAPPSSYNTINLSYAVVKYNLLARKIFLK